MRLLLALLVGGLVGCSDDQPALLDAASSDAQVADSNAADSKAVADSSADAPRPSDARADSEDHDGAAADAATDGGTAACKQWSDWACSPTEGAACNATCNDGTVIQRIFSSSGGHSSECGPDGQTPTQCGSQTFTGDPCDMCKAVLTQACCSI